jgi:4-amino-4-deoxy-L-arabinose transferase-like glycosyltransferase
VVGFTSWDAQRVLIAIVSAGAIALVGLLGRRAGGEAVGLVAAAIVAAHPAWFQYPGFLASDALYSVVASAAILAGIIAVEERTLRSAGVLGAVCGLAALTRTEAVLFAPFLVIPVCAVARRGRRILSLGTALAAMLAVLAPWLMWMHSTFGVWSMSLNGGGTLAIANCPAVYEGQHIGSVKCGLGWLGLAARGVPEDITEVEYLVYMDRSARELAVDFARDHADRLPAVAAARVGRTLGVFRLSDAVEFDVGIGGAEPYQWAGFAVNGVLLVLAPMGAVILARRRDRRSLLVLAAGPALALTTSVLIYGATRIRLSAEPSIAVGASLAIVGMARYLVAPSRSQGTGPVAASEAEVPGVLEPA